MRYRVSVEGWGNALTTAHLTREEAEQHVANSRELNPHSDPDSYRITEHDEPSRPCCYCGGEVVNDSHPETQFCRGCFYMGTHYTFQYSDRCDKLSGIVGREVTVWHTGGGCFAFGAGIENDGSILIGSDFAVDADPDEEVWGYTVQRAEDDDGYSEEPMTLWEAADRARKVADMAQEEYERLTAV